MSGWSWDDAAWHAWNEARWSSWNGGGWQSSTGDSAGAAVAENTSSAVVVENASQAASTALPLSQARTPGICVLVWRAPQAHTPQGDTPQQQLYGQPSDVNSPPHVPDDPQSRTQESHAPESRIYDVEFFRDFTDFTAHHRQHDAALKYWRWRLQEGSCSLELRPVEVIHEITHEKGMSYEIDESRNREWSWLEMVAAER